MTALAAPSGPLAEAALGGGGHWPIEARPRPPCLVRVAILSGPLGAGAFEAGLALLPAAERAEVCALRRPEDARRALSARLLARRELAAWLGCPPEGLRLVRDARSRPRLAAAPGGGVPDWNLSHAGPYVAFALHGAARVGVDVELERDALVRVRDRFVHPAERPWAGEDPGRLLALWTLKEALAKAVGLGLALPVRLCRFEVGPRARLVEAPAEAGSAAGWRFRLEAPGPGALLAVCVEGAEPPAAEPAGDPLLDCPAPTAR